MTKTISEVLHEYLDDYEFRADVDHMPTEGEQTMLEDFGLGLIEALKEAGWRIVRARIGAVEDQDG